jgi:hypothetical protein
MTATLLAHPVPSPCGSLESYLSAVRAFPFLGAEEERELALRYRREGDLDAVWKLVTSHLRYVVRIARGYRGYGLAEGDLIQEGNVGLMNPDTDLMLILAGLERAGIRRDVPHMADAELDERRRCVRDK